jgi:hypothetical protein
VTTKEVISHIAQEKSRNQHQPARRDCGCACQNIPSLPKRMRQSSE